VTRKSVAIRLLSFEREDKIDSLFFFQAIPVLPPLFSPVSASGERSFFFFSIRLLSQERSMPPFFLSPPTNYEIKVVLLSSLREKSPSFIILGKDEINPPTPKPPPPPPPPPPPQKPPHPPQPRSFNPSVGRREIRQCAFSSPVRRLTDSFWRNKIMNDKHRLCVDCFSLPPTTSMGLKRTVTLDSDVTVPRPFPLDAKPFP